MRHVKKHLNKTHTILCPQVRKTQLVRYNVVVNKNQLLVTRH
jgi:hypothetical protein